MILFGIFDPLETRKLVLQALRDFRLLDGLGRLVEIDFPRQSLNDEVQPSRIVVPINMRINPRAGPKPFLGGAPEPS